MLPLLLLQPPLLPLLLLPPLPPTRTMCCNAANLCCSYPTPPTRHIHAQVDSAFDTINPPIRRHALADIVLHKLQQAAAQLKLGADVTSGTAAGLGAAGVAAPPFLAVLRNLLCLPPSLFDLVCTYRLM